MLMQWQSVAHYCIGHFGHGRAVQELKKVGGAVEEHIDYGLMERRGLSAGRIDASAHAFLPPIVGARIRLKAIDLAP